MKTDTYRESTWGCVELVAILSCGHYIFGMANALSDTVELNYAGFPVSWEVHLDSPENVARCNAWIAANEAAAKQAADTLAAKQAADRKMFAILAIWAFGMACYFLPTAAHALAQFAINH